MLVLLCGLRGFLFLFTQGPNKENMVSVPIITGEP